MRIWNKLLLVAIASCGGPVDDVGEAIDGLTVSSATIPTCQPSLVNAITFANASTQGIEVHDPTRTADYIGMCNAESSFYVDKWRPVDGTEQTACGRFDRFSRYDEGGDFDWNIHIVPNAAHRFIIETALGHAPSATYGNCSSGPCFEAELAPDHTYVDNAWFRQDGTSPLVGREICVFGPWIKDCGHDCKPEIHPSQVIWWKDRWGASDLFWLLVLQDNTGRFDDRDNFDCNGNEPVGFRGWSDSPVGALFKIPFDLDPNGGTHKFFIGESNDRFVVTKNSASARQDTEPGVQQLVYNGRTLLQVTESLSNDDNVGTRMVQVCRNPANNHVLGYVALTTRIGGNDDRDEEGVHALYVTRTPPPTAPVVVSSVAK